MFFYFIYMTVLASVSRNTKSGLRTWTFCQDGQNFFAQSDAGKRVTAKSVEDLRGLYRKFRSWHFQPVVLTD